jgi:hypothetical protein
MFVIPRLNRASNMTVVLMWIALVLSVTLATYLYLIKQNADQYSTLEIAASAILGMFSGLSVVYLFVEAYRKFGIKLLIMAAAILYPPLFGFFIILVPVLVLFGETKRRMGV